MRQASRRVTERLDGASRRGGAPSSPRSNRRAALGLVTMETIEPVLLGAPRRPPARDRRYPDVMARRSARTTTTSRRTTPAISASPRRACRAGVGVAAGPERPTARVLVRRLRPSADGWREGRTEIARDGARSIAGGAPPPEPHRDRQGGRSNDRCRDRSHDRYSDRSYDSSDVHRALAARVPRPRPSGATSPSSSPTRPCPRCSAAAS